MSASCVAVYCLRVCHECKRKTIMNATVAGPSAGNVPPARWAHAAAVVGNIVWVYGGVGNSVLDDICALDADTLSWRIVSSHAARSKDRPEKMLGHAGRFERCVLGAFFKTGAVVMLSTTSSIVFPFMRHVCSFFPFFSSSTTFKPTSYHAFLGQLLQSAPRFGSSAGSRAVSSSVHCTASTRRHALGHGATRVLSHQPALAMLWLPSTAASSTCLAGRAGASLTTFTSLTLQLACSLKLKPQASRRPRAAAIASFGMAATT